jgi:dTMP kinase
MQNLGKLFVFEGPDGVGKSTLAQWFATHLENAGNRCTLLSFPGKEVGTLGRHVYELHHDPGKFGIDTLSEASLQLLHVAAHIDAIETRIKPLLGSGSIIVLDRFWWSTFVYGIVGGVSRSVLDGMIAVKRSAWHPVRPDRLFVISRSAPLRRGPPDLWPRWRDAYSDLAEQEIDVHPVVIVPNEQDVSAAQKRILENV